MLAAVRWTAVLMGVGAGGLVTIVASLVLWAILAGAGVDGAPGASLTFALLIGMMVAGYVAGRGAIHSHRFHGMLAGLGMAGMVVVIARLGGSPAPTPQVLLLVALSLVLSGIGGVAAGRRTRRPAS